MRINISTYAFLVILIAGFLLRIQRFDYPLSYIFAWGDGTRDFMVANHILTYGELPLTGPFNLLHEVGVRNSPIYFYLLALILAPAKNILTLSFVNILLQMSVLVLIYLMTKKIFDKATALIATSLFTFNPEVIKQADFVWQPHLMQPAALLSTYLFIHGYFRKNYNFIILSFFFLSFAIVLHNSALSWLPLFLAIAVLSGKRKLWIVVILFLSLFLLYSPLLVYYFHSPTSINTGSWGIYTTSLSSYLTNVKAHFKQFFDAFYLTNFSLAILFLSVLTYFAFIKDQLKNKLLIAIIFLFFVSPIFSASFFNKIKLHYLTLSFSSFALFVAAVLTRFPKVLMLALAIFFIVIFSGNFAITKEFKVPLENLNKIDKVTNSLVSELRQIKQKEKFEDFNFFQVVSFAQSDIDLPYPILDTVLLVPLEEKLGVKLVKISDQNPYNHFQTGSKKYLLVHCVRFKQGQTNCGDLFKKSYSGYNIKKTIHSDSLMTIYLAKHD